MVWFQFWFNSIISATERSSCNDASIRLNLQTIRSDIAIDNAASEAEKFCCVAKLTR